MNISRLSEPGGINIQTHLGFRNIFLGFTSVLYGLIERHCARLTLPLVCPFSFFAVCSMAGGMLRGLEPQMKFEGMVEIVLGNAAWVPTAKSGVELRYRAR